MGPSVEMPAGVRTEKIITMLRRTAAGAEPWEAPKAYMFTAQVVFNSVCTWA